VQFSKLLIGPVVALAYVSLTSSAVLSQRAAPSQPVLKSAKDRGSTPSTATNSTEAVVSGGMTKQQRLKDCLDTWDKGTHMTKKEWRRTCERTVRDYPELP
jgi:hypothetical protein